MYARDVIQLAQLASPGRTATLDAPLEHLVACHTRILERLDTLERIGGHFESNRDEAIRTLHSVFRFFDSNGLWHTMDEEESLFPRILPQLTTEEHAYIHELERQHDTAEAAYAELKQFMLGDDVDPSRYQGLAARLCNLYRAHIASENEHLIAICRRVLSAEQLVEISDEMKHRRGAAHG